MNGRDRAASAILISARKRVLYECSWPSKRAIKVITATATWAMRGCGMAAKGGMAEMTRRQGGYSKGKGGSLHR